MNIDSRPAARKRRLLQVPLRAAIAAACIALIAHGGPAAAQHDHGGHQAAAPAMVFAKVGENTISGEQYDAAFAQAARGKFYHGQPPQGEIALLQREVGQKLVDDILLAAEAQRRKIQPDAAEVQKTLDGYEQRYKDSAQWKENRARVLPQLTAKLQRDDVMEQLKRQVKTVPAPTQEQLQKYYEDHKDKFTSPEQVHLRIILLKVDPSAPKEKWDGARAEGAAITKRLRAGADFAELANLHSEDASAKKGGDMGYVHRGMLPETAQKEIDKLKAGDTAEPVVLLEGVAVFRLEGRKEPVLNSLDSVRPRAQDLYLRDRAEQAWTALLEKLRRETPVQMDESRYLPLAASDGDKTPAR